MRTGLDDKDWCRGEEEERKGKNLAAIDQKIARQLGMARAFAETLTRHGRRSAIQERGKVGRFLFGMEKVHGSAGAATWTGPSGREEAACSLFHPCPETACVCLLTPP